MNCAEVMEWMHRYLDHDLSRDESLEMFRHIDECPSCAELFERLNALSGELERLPDVSPPFSLVDSIMPKLEAIDREASAIADPPVQENQALPLSRKASRAKASGGGFSSMGARIGIGAAAAAVILCAAIFNMPEKLPGAQVDNMLHSETAYKAEQDTSMDSGAGDPNASGTFGTASPQSGSEDRIMEQGGASDAPGGSGMSAFIAPESPQPSSGGQVTEKGGSSKADAPTKKARKSEPDQPASSETSPSNKADPPQQSPTPSPSPQTSASPENDGGLGEAGGEENRIRSGDSGQAPSSDAGEAGITGMTPMKTQVEPASWTSPDGRYMAVVEGRNLVIYRALGDGSGGRQAVGTIAFEGALMSGEWTEDSRLFAYVTTADGREANGMYALPEESAEPSGTPSPSPSPAPSAPSPDASIK